MISFINLFSVVAMSMAIYLRLTDGSAGAFWTFAAIFGMFAITINTSYFLEGIKKEKRFK